jgi:endonuclease/exonuclease/phosphatase family metal-dependent hydrolase
MAEGFSDAQWTQIETLLEQDPGRFQFPERRENSLVIGTFNALKLGSADEGKKRWNFLRKICLSFDLLALQEIMDNLSGLERLKDSLGDETKNEYGLVVSDTTGTFPGDRGNTERLAFLFRWTRIQRNDLASDITYDRSKVLKSLYENRDKFNKWFDKFDERVRKAKAEGKDKPSLSDYATPAFLTFIRQPHCAAFEILGEDGAKGPQLFTVNAHLLYGKGVKERKREFDALLDWLILRARQRDRMYHKNILLLGDLNIEFNDSTRKREEIDARLRALNKNELSDEQAAKVNFPLLTPHPVNGQLRSNARQDETYDQIAFFGMEQEDLPSVNENHSAGHNGSDGYDYGVFSFTELFAEALHGKSFVDLSEAQRDDLISRANADVSDHMPAWVRLPVPGA